MPGPAPKRPELRQRRNKTATSATLPTEQESAGNEVPELYPKEPDWHPMVKDWWADLWRSPMAAEYLKADRAGLYLLADLQQVRWTAVDPGDLIEVAKEIRMQEQRFGLSPIDRRRLQWEVPDEPDASVPAPSPAPKGKRAAKADPRSVLRIA